VKKPIKTKSFMKNTLLMKILFTCIFLFYAADGFTQVETKVEAGKKLSGKEKRALKKKKEEQMQKELNGYVQAETVFDCAFQNQNGYRIAIMPFEADTACGNVSAAHNSENLLNEYLATYLSKIGWTVIGKERTNKNINALEKLIERNVVEGSEVREIKEKVGADVFVTGTVHAFNKGTKGSSGSHVSFSVRCHFIETACREVWSGTVESRSGAYNYDDSPIFLLKRSVSDLIDNLNAEITKCRQDEDK
jgi:hypothetical protein